MKVTYDSKVDVLWIRLKDKGIVDSDEQSPGLILDYDADGNIIGIEIHHASQRLEDPRVVEYVEA